MGKCGICGQETFWSGAKLWRAKSWLCADCLRKAGGYGSAPLMGTLEEIETAIRKNEENRKVAAEAVAEAFAPQEPFTATKTIKNFFWIDERAKKWLVPQRNGDCSKSKIYGFSDIVSFEVLENEQVKIKGGKGLALAGSLLYGAPGAIVGGIVANRTQDTICDSLKIKITVSSLENAAVYISFVEKQLSKDSATYKVVSDDVQECVSCLQVMCEKRESGYSEADELEKFKRLYDNGIISEEEYNHKKKQLLGL